MAARWIERITGPFEDKKRWRRYKARKQQFPLSYRTAIDAIERYLMYAGAIAEGTVLMRMLEDLADLIERAALDGTPIRDIVGDDPVEFADTFIRNYADGQWVNRERKRLTDAIDHAADDDTRTR
jgi:DNA-binding ferritin-like protein (Dps family)